MTLRNTRLLQVLGLLIAVIGLAGFWLNRDIPDRATLTQDQLELLGLDPAESKDIFHASFVVAGRDYDYSRPASPCRYVGGKCVRDRIGEFRLGNRTDTILYVNIIGDKLTMIALPRDIYLPQWQAKINEMYAYQGAEGLKDAVEAVVNLPIDYYAVINIDIFEDFVDALDGVDINIPYRMYYEDAAAGLTINFKEGPAHLDGEDAAKFVRYRETFRGDYDRIDNVKRLAYAVLARAKELNVRTAFRAPELVDAVFDNMETNASPALAKRLLPRLSTLTIEAATLPTTEVEGTSRLVAEPRDIERFLAGTFGGETRTFVEAPEATLLITNRSGEAGLEDLFKERLVKLGVPESLVLVREASEDPSPTRLLTTTEFWQEADYYTSLFQTSKQQIDRFATIGGKQVDLELVLGEDAAATYISKIGDGAAIQAGARSSNETR